MNEIDALLDTAFADYNAGRYEQAEALTRRVLSIEPTHGDALYLLGLIALNAGALEPAAGLLYQGVKLYPNMPGYALALASVLHKQGRLEEALSFYEKHKENPQVLAQIGLIYAAKGQDEWAKSAFLEALKKDEGLTEAVIGLANLAEKHQDFAEAERLLIHAQTVRSTPELLYQIARLYRLTNRAKQALPIINQAIDLYKSVVYINEKGLILEALGEDEAALDAYVETTKFSAYFADGFCNQGNIYLKQGHFDLAEDAYKRALALDKKFLQAHHNLASLLYKQGRKTEALEHYREAIIINPKHVESIYNLAVILEETGDYSEAAGLYFNAWALGMKHDTLDFRIAATLRGLFQSSKKGEKQALDFAKGWVRNFPDNEVAKHTLDTFTGKKTADMNKYSERLYDIFADEYDETMIKLDSRVIKNTVSLLGGKKYKNVLDLACGTGTFGKIFKLRFKSITGVDISQKMLDLAQKAEVYQKLIHASVEDFLKTDKTKYDLIVALELIGYLDNLPSFFEDVQQHLTPNGVFIFSVEKTLKKQDWELSITGRYLYNPIYIEKMLNNAGLIQKELIHAPLRKEGTEYADGFVIKSCLKQNNK
ncbi:MAG: tetratricopeptide repeat protein [Alphaproteobacteria bacterium]